MRLIATLPHELDANRFVSYLTRMGITTTVEPLLDAATSAISYQVWVHDEDRLEEAETAWKMFQQKPQDALFDTPISLDPIPRERPPLPRKPLFFTKWVLLTCIFLFFLNMSQEYSLLKEGIPEQTYAITPVQTALFFDTPKALEELEKILESDEIRLQTPGQAPDPKILAKIEEAERVPFWQGAYAWALAKAQGTTPSFLEAPLFEKISQGEVWRLLSPCFLHRDLLHILFNMLWVWILLRPVEERIGFRKSLLLTTLVGIGSNTAQYLMGGPFFIGYSGIVMGLAGFTWMREKLAPWEGYPLQKGTLLFLTLFVLGMCLLQMVSFVCQVFFQVPFSPNIANTAHLAGGGLGMLLGRWAIFRASTA